MKPEPPNYILNLSQFKDIPPQLEAPDQWVNWKYELRDGKWTKVPKNPRTGSNARVNDPLTGQAFKER